MRTGEEKPCIDEFMQDSVAEEKKEKKTKNQIRERTSYTIMIPVEKKHQLIPTIT